jgi:hypothetical protein
VVKCDVRLTQLMMRNLSTIIIPYHVLSVFLQWIENLPCQDGHTSYLFDKVLRNVTIADVLNALKSIGNDIAHGVLAEVYPGLFVKLLFAVDFETISVLCVAYCRGLVNQLMPSFPS